MHIVGAADAAKSCSCPCTVKCHVIIPIMRAQYLKHGVPWLDYEGFGRERTAGDVFQEEADQGVVVVTSQQRL